MAFSTNSNNVIIKNIQISKQSQSRKQTWQTNKKPTYLLIWDYPPKVTLVLTNNNHTLVSRQQLHPLPNFSFFANSSPFQPVSLFLAHCPSNIFHPSTDYSPDNDFPWICSLVVKDNIGINRSAQDLHLDKIYWSFFFLSLIRIKVKS